MCVRGKGAVVEVSVGVMAAAQTVQRQVRPMVSPFGSATQHRCVCERTVVADAAGAFSGKAAARRAAARDARGRDASVDCTHSRQISPRSAHQGRWRLPLAASALTTGGPACARQPGPAANFQRSPFGNPPVGRAWHCRTGNPHARAKRVHAMKHAPPSNHGSSVGTLRPPTAAVASRIPTPTPWSPHDPAFPPCATRHGNCICRTARRLPQGRHRRRCRGRRRQDQCLHRVFQRGGAATARATSNTLAG